MSLPSQTPTPPPTTRRGLATMGVVLVLASGFGFASACFKSDDNPIDEPGTTTGETYGPNPTTSDSGEETTTGEDPEVDCEDAIECVLGCSATLLEDDFDPAEPDLSCFLACEPGLTTEEALDLLRLTECVTNLCVEAGECQPLAEPTDGGTTGGVTSGGTGEGEFPCLTCVSTFLQDPEPPGCIDEAASCRD